MGPVVRFDAAITPAAEGQKFRYGLLTGCHGCRIELGLHNDRQERTTGSGKKARSVSLSNVHTIQYECSEWSFQFLLGV